MDAKQKWPKMGATKRDIRERFFEKIKRVESGCWEWQGGTIGKGYGSFAIDNVPRYAHRVSWFLHHGEWPPRRTPGARCAVMHSCDNPKCVNPDHLSLGTNAENLDDMARKGRSLVGWVRGSEDGKLIWVKPGPAVRARRAKTAHGYIPVGGYSAREKELDHEQQPIV